MLLCHLQCKNKIKGWVVWFFVCDQANLDHLIHPWWCTGHGSPSQVGAVAAAAAAAASMGTDCTERMDPLGAMIS